MKAHKSFILFHCNLDGEQFNPPGALIVSVLQFGEDVLEQGVEIVDRRELRVRGLQPGSGVEEEAGLNIGSLEGKTLAMPSTTEAYNVFADAAKTLDKLDSVIRLVGGTMVCFNYLYSGKCDVVLTDTTALMYYNCH